MLIRRQGSRPSPRKRNAKNQNGCLRGLTNICEKKRSQKQKRKGRIYPFECRVPKNSRRDKKASLSDQCKEIEENNRIGKARNLFKKSRDTKGIFHANMGSIKDRNSMDLTEAKILRRCGKNTQKNCTKKDRHDQIIMMV